MKLLLTSTVKVILVLARENLVQLNQAPIGAVSKSEYNLALDRQAKDYGHTVSCPP